jgi:hypothetical protein
MFGEKELKILNEVCKALDSAPRTGTETDSPEGFKYILISDTAAKKISADLNDVGMFIIDLRSKL